MGKGKNEKKRKKKDDLNYKAGRIVPEKKKFRKKKNWFFG